MESIQLSRALSVTSVLHLKATYEFTSSTSIKWLPLTLTSFKLLVIMTVIFLVMLLCDFFSMFIALVVRPENPFKCEQCGRGYKWKETLKRHLIHECGMEKSLKCPHCAFRAKMKSNLNSHVKNVHGEGPASISPK